MSKYTFFVPQGFDIDKLMAATPPKIEQFRKEKVLYIIDIITQIPARNHDVGDEDGYVPINSSILRDNIGNRYWQYLDWLVKCGVLECNNHFSVERSISRKYRFTPAYDLPIQKYTDDISVWLERKLVPAATTYQQSKHNWWEYATEPPLCPSLVNKLPVNGSTLNLGELEEYNKWMRSLYPSVFNWYDQKGLQIDDKLANQYNDSYWQFREQGYMEIVKRWNGKKAMWLPKKPTSQHRSNRYNILDVTRQNYYPHFDTNVLRLYSSIGSLNKELRPAISWQGQPLVAVDISNSQPYLLATLLNPDFWLNDNNTKATVTLYDLPYNHNYNTTYPTTDIITLCNFLRANPQKDVELFTRIVSSGRFYESLARLMPATQSGKRYTRAEIKRLMLIVLFSKNEAIDQGWAKAKREFAKLFPNINELIRLIQGDSSANLPCLLQRLESHLIFNHVVPRICAECSNVPMFTIHDSIVTTQGNERNIARILREELHYATGLMPSYKYDYWNAGNLEYNLSNEQNMFEILQDYYYNGDPLRGDFMGFHFDNPGIF